MTMGASREKFLFDQGLSSIGSRRSIKLLYIVNTAAFFCSHRFNLATAARDNGIEVLLLTGLASNTHLEAAATRRLASAGIEHCVTQFTSAKTGMKDIWGILAMTAAIRAWKPNIIHCVSPKGILYGCIAARLSGAKSLILAVSGMGRLFSGQSGSKTSIVQKLYLWLLKAMTFGKRVHVIVQNTDDRQLLKTSLNLDDDSITFIPGSGVCVAEYPKVAWSDRDDLVVFPARLLKEKGVVEFVDAASKLKKSGSTWRFALMGSCDYDNPDVISERTVTDWVNQGLIEWWGHVENVPAVLVKAKIVCLPSYYREGLPKILLEAAAAGCAVVTTDSIGCREAILPGQTGDLVPVRDARALEKALKALIDDPVRQKRYGEAGRLMAAEKFNIEHVINHTLAIYSNMIA
jgi:glycosyltransferase involved in cell wall biosynthesis